MTEDKSYVLVDNFGGNGGAANAIGPFAYKEADDFLKKGAAICGDYKKPQAIGAIFQVGGLMMNIVG